MNELVRLSRIHKQHGIIVDTNILLLLVVGLVNVNYIAAYKRTAMFTGEDYYILLNALTFFDTHLVTPHVLTEVSNLIGQSSNPSPEKLRTVLRRLIPRCNEVSRDSASLANRPEFLQFGIADTGIAELASSGALVLTDDSKLYHYLSGTGRSVVNFNHIRTYARNV